MKIELTLDFANYSRFIRHNGPIESKLPNELIMMVFSHLPDSDLTSTYCVNKRWKDITLDPIRRREAKLFKSYIRFIADNTLEGKYAKTKEKIENLIFEIKLSEDTVIDLLQLKTTFLDSKKQLITFLKELDNDKQQELRALSENAPKPLHLNSTFDFADPVRRVRNLLRIINLRHRLNILENRNNHVQPVVEGLRPILAALFPNRDANEIEILDVD